MKHLGFIEKANHQTKTTARTTKTDDTQFPGQICVSPMRSKAKQGTGPGPNKQPHKKHQICH
jgi:hypothetical protein